MILYYTRPHGDARNTPHKRDGNWALSSELPIDVQKEDEEKATAWSVFRLIH
jgi:hypothetical protein